MFFFLKLSETVRAEEEDQVGLQAPEDPMTPQPTLVQLFLIAQTPLDPFHLLLCTLSQILP